MRAAIFCLLLSAVAISADLQSDIDDIVNHLPTKQLQVIGQKYLAADPSIRPALVYMQTHPFEQIVKGGLKAKEVQDLLEYFNRHGIDGEKTLLHYIKISLDFQRKLLEEQVEDDGTGPAITGNILADFLKVVSQSNFLSFVAEKMQTSPDYANFVAALRDPEFMTLYQRAMRINHPLVNSKSPLARGFFSKVWKKIKDIGFGVSVSIPLGK